MTAVCIQNLTKQYKNELAVDDISFTVAAGSITALLGGNGAGKTTTIAMLVGALQPTSGTITVLGHDMVKNRYPALSRMNFSSPYVDLPRKLSVRENLRIYGGLYNVRNIERHIGKVAEELDLVGFLDCHVGRLSAGQQTRVSLAKALINTPAVLLLDEPTASLDPDTADRIRKYLDDFRKKHGTTVILASHNMREVEKLCDHVLMMKKGKVVDQGTPKALVDKYGRKDMEEVFLHVARREEAAA
jgi:ABC-2 type transport system ATP-binding protein